jgi:hypothetical protein
VTVESKDGAETVVTITEKTEYITPKSSDKIDLEKVSKTLERVQEKGRKGLPVKVTHDKGTASKIEVEARKKGEGKKKLD